MMEARDLMESARLEKLRRDIREGIEGGVSGKLDIDAIKQRGRARLAAAGR